MRAVKKCGSKSQNLRPMRYFLSVVLCFFRFLGRVATLANTYNKFASGSYYFYLKFIFLVSKYTKIVRSFMLLHPRDC